jgi:hypothetical protein
MPLDNDFKQFNNNQTATYVPYELLMGWPFFAYSSGQFLMGDLKKCGEIAEGRGFSGDIV